MRTNLVCKRSALAILAMLSIAGLLSVGCGGSNSPAEAQTQAVKTHRPASVQQASPAPAAPTQAPVVTAAPATPAPVVATPAPTPEPTAAPLVPVDVTISLSEFKIESSLTTFQAGVPYHLIVTNNGKVTHEANIGDVNATGEIAVGATKTLDVTFPDPGQQVFACHIKGHFEAGMKLDVTVQS